MSQRLPLLTIAATLAFSAAAGAAPPAVVTDIPAVAALTQQVLGNLGQPETLLEAGADPHHYQLRPSQARSLQSAGLLVWIGPEMSPWLDRTAESLGAEISLPLLRTPGTLLRSYDGDEGHDHDHEHNHDHGHDHSGSDPHAWLDPDNGMLWLKRIAETLAAKDPANATTYHANAEAGIARLEALDTRLAADLAPIKGKHFAVTHDAYGYFTAHYGLEPAIAVSLGDASAPSAARLKQVQAQINANNVTCAFPETGHDPRLLQTAIEGTAARPGPALNPEGTGLEPGVLLYDQILEGMAQSIRDCLSAP